MDRAVFFQELRRVLQREGFTTQAEQDKVAKSAALHQGGAALTCWTQGRFIVDLPEGLTLTEY